MLASLFILCGTPLPLAYALPSPRMLAGAGMCGAPLSPYSTRVPNSTRNAASNKKRKSGNHNSLNLNAIAVRQADYRWKAPPAKLSFPLHLMGSLGTSPQLVSQATLSIPQYADRILRVWPAYSVISSLMVPLPMRTRELETEDCSHAGAHKAGETDVSGIPARLPGGFPHPLWVAGRIR